MKKKLALLLACSMALSLTACGGGSKPAETTAAPETTTAAASEAAKEESKEDAAETTAAEAAGGDMDALIEAAKAEGELTVYGSCEARILRSCTESRRNTRDFPHQRFIPRYPRKQASRLPTYGLAELQTPITRQWLTVF